ncbi:signal peptidase I [Candidatus Woesearchaeota archaeon]|nr:signal peptidase I [Candidatus Woesearchaeota archaeon]
MFRKKKRVVEQSAWKPKSFWGRLWYFIWYDDSAWSWLANVVLAYIIIKFLFYPAIGFLLGTNFPIVAVVSTSMVHDQPFDAWWTAHEDDYLALGITKANFSGYDFRNGFNKGDLMLLIGKDPEDVEVGDVIVFQSKKPYPIIHRVIRKEDKGMWVFQTKGDNNAAQIRDSELDETYVLEKVILGKAVGRIPWLGYIKIWFVDGLRMVGVRV